MDNLPTILIALAGFLFAAFGVGFAGARFRARSPDPPALPPKAATDNQTDNATERTRVDAARSARDANVLRIEEAVKASDPNERRKRLAEASKHGKL